MEFTYMKTPLYKFTFKNKRIREWVESQVLGYTLNLFAGETKLNCVEVRNDMREEMPADYHMDAFEFVKWWKDTNPNSLFDSVVLDPPYCYDTKTEILTENGWKLFKQLDKNEKVATLNPETHCLEYQKPISYFSDMYDGEMVKIKSGSVNLVVTPNHKLYVKKLWFTNKFKLIEADKVNFGFESKSNCNWVGIDEPFFTLPSVKFERHNRYNEIEASEKKIPMKDWLRFLGIYLAEGCCDNYRNEYRIRIAQIKEHNRPIIEKWIKDIGFHYLTEKNGFAIYNKQLWTYLRQLGKTKEKFIPKKTKNLSPMYLNCLFEGLMLGDGHRSKKKVWNKKYKKYYTDNHCSYCSYSKQLINDMSEIILKLGMVSTFYKVNNEGYVLNITNYRLTPMIRKNKLDEYITHVPYKGYIYCVEVPNHIIYVRRNGKSVWCGNSYRKSMTRYEGAVSSDFNRVKNFLPKIMAYRGNVITFGYHSNVMGKVRGFTQEHLLVMSHGGAIHDTIAVNERRLAIHE